MPLETLSLAYENNSRAQQQFLRTHAIADVAVELYKIMGIAVPAYVSNTLPKHLVQ